MFQSFAQPYWLSMDLQLISNDSSFHTVINAQGPLKIHRNIQQSPSSTDFGILQARLKTKKQIYITTAVDYLIHIAYNATDCEVCAFIIAFLFPI